MDKEFKLQNIKLIVTLGNIGREYNNTRHNAGFMFADKLLNGITLQEDTKLKALIAKKELGNQILLIAKPITLMNLSGESVQAIKNYYKIENDQILIVHDDLDLELGNYKLQFSKGPHEHNGINSIERHIGNDFWRLRLGIDNRTADERKFMVGRDYVLGRFSLDEQATMEETFVEIVQTITSSH